MNSDLEIYTQSLRSLNAFLSDDRALLREVDGNLYPVRIPYRRPGDLKREDVFHLITAGFGGDQRAREFFAGKFSDSEMVLAVDWIAEGFRRDRRRASA